jgi:hypothetical protein
MRKQPSLIATVGVASLALIVGSSCRREAAQTEPAKTTTEGGTTTAPPAKEAAQRDAALVRAVNAIPAPAPADIYADDLKAFSDVKYKEITPYKELQDNEVTFKVELAGNPQASDQEREILMDGRHYTVFAMPGAKKDDPAALRVLADELVPPDPGKSKVRVVNTSPDAPNMDLMIAGQKDPVISGVGRQDSTGYKEIVPVMGKITLRDDQKQVVANVDATMEPGKLYTVIVVGKTTGTPKAEAFVVQDELAPAKESTTGAVPPPQKY